MENGVKGRQLGDFLHWSKRNRAESTEGRIWDWLGEKRLLGLSIVVICLYLIMTSVRALVGLWQAGDKITVRERALVTLERENRSLLAEQAKASSSGFVEKMARDKLGLSKPGEEVIVVPEELVAERSVASVAAVPNWKKWVKLWF